jgi:GNAT superfamily N-acetyltransferase
MKLEMLSKQVELNNIGKCIVGLWNPEDGPEIYDQVEKLNWAPWLSASSQTLSGRAKVFPEGHLIIKDIAGKNILATLSTNRINWDGDITHLPDWDSVAGEPTDYSNTYEPEGNTLTLMSMNVHPEFQGTGLARQLLGLIKEQAKKLGVKHLIGSFRPNEFGKFKAKEENWHVDFEGYCKMSRVDGWPIDGWLRSLMKNGMEPLVVDHKAMTVIVSLDEFEQYKSIYNLGKWKEVAPEVWECGEVGQWKIENNQAVYQECNLWGKLPME